MPVQYVVGRRRRLDIDEEPESEGSYAKTVYEPDPTPIGTGIQSGVEIFRVHRLGPIGFIRHETD
jgi:hypothetical protein